MSTGLLDQTAVKKPRQLVPVLGSHWQLSWPCVVVVGWFALVFLQISHTPLSLSETWRHANTGHWILTEGTAPNHVPGVPLATAAQPLSDSWLFDAVAGLIAGRFGPEAISAMIAVVISIALWCWSWLFYRNSHSVVYVLFSAVVMSVVWSTSFGIFDPRIVAALLMAVLFWLITPARPFGRLELDDDEELFKLNSYRWLASICVFALWANIHVSFLIGLLLLAAIAIGNLVDQFLSQGFGGLVSRTSLRWIFLFQFCCLATLATPHHLKLWQYCLTSGLEQFLWKISAGQGMYLPTVAGCTMLGLLGLVFWRFAQSKTQRSTAEVLLLILAAGLATTNAKHLFWLAPLTQLIGSRHWLPEVAKSKLTEAPAADDKPSPLRFAASLTCLLFMWLGFALAPISSPILGRAERSYEKLFDARVPRDLSVALSENLVLEGTEGLVWAPADWSDWLLWDGPSSVQLFANSALERLPAQVRSDYEVIFGAGSNWESLLDSYEVSTLVVDKQRQHALVGSAQRSLHWQLVLERPQSLVFQRTTALPSAQSRTQKRKSKKKSIEKV